MDKRASPLEDWDDFLSWLSSFVDIEGSARSAGAVSRLRTIRSASDLLRLSVAWSVCGLSLRGTCAFSEASGIGRLSDPSLLERLCKASGWLEHLVCRVLSGRLGSVGESGWSRLRLIDATTACHPGADRTTWRLHVAYDPVSGRVAQIEVSDIHGGESLTRFAFAPGEVSVSDAGYARVKDFRHLERQGAHGIVRISWNTLALRTAEGERFDLFAVLRGLEGTVAEVPVRAVDDEGCVPVRLIIARKPAEAAEQTRKRVIRMAKKKKKKPDPRSLEAAEYLILVTTLPQDVSAQDALALYRLRWQIELVFKRWKSLLDLDALPAKNPDLARAWLFTKLLAALFIEDQIAAICDIPPSAPSKALQNALALDAHRSPRSSLSRSRLRTRKALENPPPLKSHPIQNSSANPTTTAPNAGL